MMDLCTNGNSYVHIERAGNGLPYSLICMDYNYIKILSKDQYLFYQYQKNGETYDSEDVLHFKLMTQDGIVGLSPIEQCKNAIGWGMAVEEYGNTFFKNGAKLSGVLQTDRALSEQAIDRLRNSFNSTYSKLSGSNQTAVLEEGLQFKPVAISAEQAQFLASRTFSVEEVARIFNLPPHMLKDLSKSSFNNIEMQSQEFVTYTLMPYLTRIEEEMNLKLFRKTERGKKFIEFSAMGLLRGNIKDRTDYYRTMLNIGAMSINEIRRKENMNSIEEGDNHFMQLNMTTLNNIGNASE
jgi:HK97 family phage portal protein